MITCIHTLSVLQVKDKMYQAAHWVSTHSLPPEANGSPAHCPPPRQEGERGRGKKEVSFSLDEDADREGEADTSGSMGSVFGQGQGQDNNNMVCAYILMIL